MGGHPKKAKAKATVMQPLSPERLPLNLSHRQVEYLIVGIVVIVMGTAAVIRWHHQSKTNTQKHDITYNLNLANQLIANNHPEQAETLLNAYIADNKGNKANVSQAQRMLSAVFQAEHKPAKANQALNQAVGNSKGSYGDYIMLGDNAAAAGDKAGAIKYYKQALADLKASNPPGASAYIGYTQNKITTLGGR
jgi:predicted negative regulator of RcsB-dependent stress response